MRKKVLKAGAVAVAVAAITTAWHAPASAADLGAWSRTTTGGAGNGKVSVENGYVYNRVTVFDKAADGHCVYVKTEWQRHDSIINAWFTVQRAQTRVCGNGTNEYKAVKRSVDELDTGPTDKLRVKARVCREDALSDTCSGWYQSSNYEV